MFSVEKDIQVRYAETDQMGVVYHANYLVWFEIGRTQLIESLGFTYASMEEEGFFSPVIDIHATYKKPVRYGEKPKIRTWLEKYDGLRVTYFYEILNENNEVCISGHSVHIAVKKDSFRPVSIKKHLPHWHEEYEKIKRN